MASQRSELHQPVFPVLAVQVEDKPHEDGGGDDPEADTDTLCDTRHIHHHEQDEDRQQTAAEDEQVLRLQALELDRTTYPFIDRIFHCFLLFGIKGRRNGGWLPPR
ncbi:putative uncharacterized protein [Eggerthella sp. CAG:1427]|nr:putative uncharacterized protein [Eggerthella sp. CAG:1427]